MLEGRGSTLEKEMPRDGIKESEHDQKVTDEVNRVESSVVSFAESQSSWVGCMRGPTPLCYLPPCFLPQRHCFLLPGVQSN